MGIFPYGDDQTSVDGLGPRSYFANALQATRFRISEESRVCALTRKLKTYS